MKDLEGEELEIDSDELVREINLEIDKGQEPTRIDKYLVSHVERISRSKFQAAADSGSLLVNDKPVKSSYKVSPLDKIKVILPLPFGHEGIKPEDIPLNIVHEDNDMLIINKPAGMVVHPGVGNYKGTLVNALLFHIKNLGKGQDAMKPGIVHRLDKDTSGIMVLAKTDFSMAYLAKQFFDKTNHRKYIALVWGDLDTNEGTINKNIGRDKFERKRMKTFEDDFEGKPSITHYKVLERFGYCTLVECVLETGRTHQIRVHMASMGHPVFNDDRYGGNVIVKGTVFSKYKQFVENCFKVCPRQALHAKELGIEHPETKKWMSFDSELPEDMTTLIEKWRAYSRGRLLEFEETTL
jgi:23S rRNA pseudouridine1911/1915/1917 synthase